MKSVKCYRYDKVGVDDDVIIVYWGKGNIVFLNKGKSYLFIKYRKGIIYFYNLFRFLNSDWKDFVEN